MLFSGEAGASYAALKERVGACQIDNEQPNRPVDVCIYVVATNVAPFGTPEIIALAEIAS